jgi:hypothetical protein
VLEEFGIPYYLKIDIEGNDILCVQDLDPRTLPQFISIETGSLNALALLRERGFKRFKCISQFNFLPLELPPGIEQCRYERAQWLAYTKNPLVRTFRFLGGRAWIRQELNRNRTYNGLQFSQKFDGRPKIISALIRSSHCRFSQ